MGRPKKGEERNYYKELLKLSEFDTKLFLDIDLTYLKNNNRNRELKIRYKCSDCKNQYEKTIRAILDKSGLYCKKCSVQKSLLKIKESNNPNYRNYYKELLELSEFNDNLFPKNELIQFKKKNTRDYIINFNCYCCKLFTQKVIRVIVENTGLKCEKCCKDEGYKKAIDTIRQNNPEYPSITSTTQIPKIKKKQEDTLYKNLGVRVPTKSTKVIDKIKKTNLKKYGVENVSQVYEFQEKRRQTNLDKWGTKYYLSTDDAKQKREQFYLSNHGVKHPIQVQEIFDKQQRHMRGAKSYNFKTGQTISLRGYEHITLKILENNYGYVYDDYNFNKLKFMYNDNEKEHRYFPDIPFLKQNKIIEVKSKWTLCADLDINLKKWESVIDKGFNFELWINDNKDNIVILTNFSLKSIYDFMKSIINKSFEIFKYCIEYNKHKLNKEVFNKHKLNKEVLSHFKSSRA